MRKRPEHRNLVALLLAAGPSSRLGQPKQLVRFKGDPLVRHAALQLLELEPHSLRVVTGCYADEVRLALEGLPVELVHNEHWAAGMGGSIACGAATLPQSAGGLLISLSDLWRVTSKDFQQLISAHLSNISGIVVSSWNDQERLYYGPPAIFPRNKIHELTKLRPDRGARSLIEQNRGESSFVNVPNAAFDLDRPEDLEWLRGFESGRQGAPPS